MMYRSIRGGAFNLLKFKFSSVSKIDVPPSTRFDNLLERVNHKSRRRQYNEFLNIKLQANYKQTYNKVSLKEQLNKSLGGFKFDNFFLDLNNTKITLDPWQRKVDQWYIKPRKTQLIETFKDLSNKFVREILEQTRDGVVRAEPNFQLQLRRSMRSIIASNGKVSITPQQNEQQVQILFSELYKGLKLSRNQNFEQQSYAINTLRQNQGIFQYLPVKQQNDRFPESSIQNINSLILKVTCALNFPFTVNINYRGQSRKVHSSSQHIVVFQNQLRSPPMFSEWSLSAQQYLKSFRFNKPWLITDIDNSSKFIDYLYPMSVKTKDLINALQQ